MEKFWKWWQENSYKLENRMTFSDAQMLWQAATERAAGIVDAECARVLAAQKAGAVEGSFDYEVNQNIRMVAVLLPDLAAAIRKG